ncbi:MAG: hypothetical protein BIFFINMI_01837 [Phycisphaerae bacterium]|nr:hypothetical protein [Phycisphaerae bacterium]
MPAAPRCLCRLLIGVLLLAASTALADDDEYNPLLPAPTVKDAPNTGEPKDAGTDEDAPADPATPGRDDAADSVDRILAKLPQKWTNSGDLLQAAIEINSMLAKADDDRQWVPWKLADGFHRSLAAGRGLLGGIALEHQAAYHQGFYLAAMAAGRPADALSAARELIHQSPETPWNYLALYDAGRLTGQPRVCQEGIDGLAARLPKDKQSMLNAMRAEASAIGPVAAFKLVLSDGTTFDTARQGGDAVVFDMWKYDARTYEQAVDLIRKVYVRYRAFPHFRMIGINRDGRSGVNAARVFMVNHDVTWPQYFDGFPGKVAREAFHSVAIPDLAVLAPSGKVIYVGMPNEPLFHYAIRAALVEANGKRMPAATTQPDDQETGRPKVAPTPLPTPPRQQPPTPDTAAKAAAEKEAQRKYDLAVLYEKNDMKAKAIELYNEILTRWPDAAVAVKAQAALTRLEYIAP